MQNHNNKQWNETGNHNNPKNIQYQTSRQYNYSNSIVLDLPLIISDIEFKKVDELTLIHYET